MARTPPGKTKARLVEEAMRLFARQGYRATSVEQIQVASGLTAGSGAFYKHFKSKRELLEAAVTGAIEQMNIRSEEAVAERPVSFPDAVELVVDLTWGTIAQDRELIRVMLRDHAELPDGFASLWDSVLATLYRRFTAWVGEVAATGSAAAFDAQAFAAVQLAGLTYRPILELLIGEVPGEVELERFKVAWIRSTLAGLTVVLQDV
ncbi:TetR/AcrR family transcriptional regulator [Nocardia sp. NPDC004750]